MNLRFAGAKQQGLTEDLVDAIGDGWETSALPDRHKVAIRVTDQIVKNPSPLPADVAAQLPRSELVELVVTAALASAFSKAAITWGPPPQMPTLEVSTPTPNPEDRTA